MPGDTRAASTLRPSKTKRATVVRTRRRIRQRFETTLILPPGELTREKAEQWLRIDLPAFLLMCEHQIGADRVEPYDTRVLLRDLQVMSEACVRALAGRPVRVEFQGPLPSLIRGKDPISDREWNAWAAEKLERIIDYARGYAHLYPGTLSRMSRALRQRQQLAEADNGR